MNDPATLKVAGGIVVFVKSDKTVGFRQNVFLGYLDPLAKGCFVSFSQALQLLSYLAFQAVLILPLCPFSVLLFCIYLRAQQSRRSYPKKLGGNKKRAKTRQKSQPLDINIIYKIPINNYQISTPKYHKINLICFILTPSSKTRVSFCEQCTKTNLFFGQSDTEGQKRAVPQGHRPKICFIPQQPLPGRCYAGGSYRPCGNHTQR